MFLYGNMKSESLFFYAKMLILEFIEFIEF